MAHSITVNLPNIPDGEQIVTEFGVAENGGTLELNDDQVAVWQFNNPDRELPTAINHDQSRQQRLDALAELRRPADEGESDQNVKFRHDQADGIEESLRRQRTILDRSATSLANDAPGRSGRPTTTTPVRPTGSATTPTPDSGANTEGDQ